MTDNTEARQNENVDFRMAKESEEVLVKNGISAASRIKEDGFEVTIHEKHGNRARKNGQRKEQKEGRDQN